jgi:hypothetical protein
MRLLIKSFKGNAILPYLDDVALLRIEIFCDYPYLYEGDMEYESNYLKTYAECSDTWLLITVKSLAHQLQCH